MNKDKDMFLPIWVLVLGIVFLVGALICIILAITTSINLLIGFAVCMGFGISGVLCWKNQWIMMIDNNTFVYSTMFGNKKQYQFVEIKELKQNSDSFSLVCEGGKIHIESCAILSERFITAADNILEKRYAENSKD